MCDFGGKDWMEERLVLEATYNNGGTVTVTERSKRSIADRLVKKEVLRVTDAVFGRTLRTYELTELGERVSRAVFTS